MASEPVTMTQSYDPQIMNNWLSLMTSMGSAITSAGEFPMPVFFPFGTYHGEDPARQSFTAVRELYDIDVNSDMNSQWDSAFAHTNTPTMFPREDELYAQFRAQNELPPNKVADVLAAYVEQQTELLDNKVMPTLGLKFIANNCVFSSLYAQARIDLYKQIQVDADKVAADLQVNQTDKAASRTAELLRSVMTSHAGFMLGRGDLSMKRVQMKLGFASDRAKTSLQANLNASADRFNLVKAQYQINLDQHRWPMDNLKYLIAAQGAMQGISALSQSQSGSEALTGFSRTAYDAGNMINLATSVGTLGLGVYNAYKNS